MKVICMYLPQYHEVPENNKWWGEGYTEWTAVKKSKPIFKGHAQPKIPVNGYYDLDKEFRETLLTQARLMKEYDVYGLCFYHYWFSGKLLLERPLEKLLKNPDIDIKFSLCWANESWSRTWDGNAKEILAKQEYGEKTEWKAHYEYLFNYFKDERYIKIDNKPMIHIYKSSDIPCFVEMMEYWNELARESGFNGLYIVVGNTMGNIETRGESFDAYYNFEPGYSLRHKRNGIKKFIYFVECFLKMKLNVIFKTKLMEHLIDGNEIYKLTTKNSKNILSDKKTYYGTFPSWDNTPRRNYKGTVIKNCTPESFKDNLRSIKKISDCNDFVYINAWNEWSEGAYLEGDTINGYEYLQAIKDVFYENSEA